VQVKKLTELGHKPASPRRLALLDVGALSVNYAKIPWIDADAIDLNARVPGITQVDFFDFEPSPQRLLASSSSSSPSSSSTGVAADQHGGGGGGEGGPYDVVSLSLVVNFVPDAGKRGEMLQRSCALLKPGGILFVVLPRACVDNSRYVTDESLRAVFAALGLDVEHQHLSLKLAFYVLRLSLAHPHRYKNPDREPFKRRLLRPGESRNNFVITLTSGARSS
jgi:25S rRNA (adenine2142-N1)-methyltransferase